MKRTPRSQKRFRWRITGIKASPAAIIGYVKTPDQDQAIRVAIREYRITRAPDPPLPKVGAVCGKAARTVLCGGRSAMSVPTAISGLVYPQLALWGAVVMCEPCSAG
jgi:hypothetical protein